MKEDWLVFCCEMIKSGSPSILQLEERKSENEAACESHREKIQQLWDRLQVPQEDREAFNEHMVLSRKRNLEAVRRLVLHAADRHQWLTCWWLRPLC